MNGGIARMYGQVLNIEICSALRLRHSIRWIAIGFAPRAQSGNKFHRSRKCKLNLSHSTALETSFACDGFTGMNNWPSRPRRGGNTSGERKETGRKNRGNMPRFFNTDWPLDDGRQLSRRPYYRLCGSFPLLSLTTPGRLIFPLSTAKTAGIRYRSR